MSDYCTVPVLLGRCNFNVGKKKEKEGRAHISSFRTLQGKREGKEKKREEKKEETKSE